MPTINTKSAVMLWVRYKSEPPKITWQNGKNEILSLSVCVIPYNPIKNRGINTKENASAMAKRQNAFSILYGYTIQVAPAKSEAILF